MAAGIGVDRSHDSPNWAVVMQRNNALVSHFRNPLDDVPHNSIKRMISVDVNEVKRCVLNISNDIEASFPCDRNRKPLKVRECSGVDPPLLSLSTTSDVRFPGIYAQQP